MRILSAHSGRRHNEETAKEQFDHLWAKSDEEERNTSADETAERSIYAG